jgi:hypothetical protein
MQTFKQFLSEGNVTDNLEDAITTIRRSCSEFLKLNTQPLWRGMNISSTLLQDFKTPVDRRPTSSSRELSRLLDRAIERKVGFKSRSEGTFVTASERVARDYGQLCLFFPKNGFQYAWSPAVRDLYTAFEDGGSNDDFVEKARGLLIDEARANGDEDMAEEILGWDDGDVIAQVMGTLSDSDIGEELATYMAKDYKNTDLAAASRSKCEISFNGDYYLVNVKTLKNKFNIEPEQFFKDLTRNENV